MDDYHDTIPAPPLTEIPPEDTLRDIEVIKLEEELLEEELLEEENIRQ